MFQTNGVACDQVFEFTCIIEGKRVFIDYLTCVNGPNVISETWIIVKNLPENVYYDNLYDVFSVYGTILSCKVLIHPQTGQSTGIGHVHYSTEKEALAAIRGVCGNHIFGTTLFADYLTAENSFSEQVQKERVENSHKNFNNDDEKFSGFGETRQNIGSGRGHLHYCTPKTAQKATEGVYAHTNKTEKVWIGTWKVLSDSLSYSIHT